MSVGGVDDVVEAVKADLRSLHDATLSRLQFGRAASDATPGQSVAEGLLQQTQKMVEQDMQDTFLSLTKSLEAKLNRMLETVGGVQSGALEHQLDVDTKVADMKKAVTKGEAKTAESTAAVAKLKARVGQAEQSCRDVEASSEAVSLQVAQSLRGMEQSLAKHDEVLAKMNAKLDGVVARQEEHAKQLAALKADAEAAARDRPRLAALEQKARDLEDYNENFMELSKRSTQGFESDIDNRLAGLDARYAALLKHYHATVMQHVAGVQEAVDGKTRSLHASLESEVARLSEDTSNIAITSRNSADQLSAEIKTLTRRLLNGLRLMKDVGGFGSSAAGGAPADPLPMAAPFPVSPQRQHTVDLGLNGANGFASTLPGTMGRQAGQSDQYLSAPASTIPTSTPSALRMGAAGGVGNGSRSAAVSSSFTPSGFYPTPQPTTRSLNVSVATEASATTLRPQPSPSHRQGGGQSSVAASTAKIDEFLRGLEQLTGGGA